MSKHQSNERYFRVYLRYKALFCMQPYNYTTKVFESHQRKIKWQIWHILINPHYPIHYIDGPMLLRPNQVKNFFEKKIDSVWLFDILLLPLRSNINKIIMKLEEIGKKNYACVYCITFKNGKQYVGQTRCMAKRAGLYVRNLNDGKINSYCLSAIKEFGLESTDWKVLCKVSEMSEDDKVLCLNILEMKYIKKLNTLYPNGYNRTNGGESLRVSNGDIDLLSCGNFFNNEKRLSMYNLDGIFIREYESISKCAYELGISRKCVSDNVNNRSSSFLGKYILREIIGGRYPKKIEPFKRTFVTKTITNVIHKDRVIYKDKIVYVDKFVDRNIQVNGKRVLKYNLDGDFVEEYDSIAKASSSVGRSYVKMNRVTCGYYFKLKTGDEIETNIGKQHEILKLEINMAANGEKNKNHNLRNDFELEQYSKDGTLVSTYWGIRVASEKTGIPYSGIWSCIFGNSKSAGGFLWKRK